MSCTCCKAELTCKLHCDLLAICSCAQAMALLAACFITVLAGCRRAAGHADCVQVLQDDPLQASVEKLMPMKQLVQDKLPWQAPGIKTLSTWSKHSGC